GGGVELYHPFPRDVVSLRSQRRVGLGHMARVGGARHRGNHRHRYTGTGRRHCGVGQAISLGSSGWSLSSAVVTSSSAMPGCSETESTRSLSRHSRYVSGRPSCGSSTPTRSHHDTAFCPVSPAETTATSRRIGSLTSGKLAWMQVVIAFSAIPAMSSS